MEISRKTGITTILHTALFTTDQGKNKKDSNFTIKVANTLEEREAVFKMAYDSYLAKGFTAQRQDGNLVFTYDLSKDTLILIIKDKADELVATATLVFEESCTLPAENIYAQEINSLRNLGRKTVELCRLCIRPDYRNSKEILVLLFNYIAIYITKIKNYHSLIIEVNPRHKAYYKALLQFTEIGALKECPHVENAPSVLLHLSTETYQEAIKVAVANKTTNNSRTLFSDFLKTEEEQQLVAQLLHKQSKPMTIEEKIYFGLIEADIAEAQLA